MNQSESILDPATQLAEARARRDSLVQSLLAMNGGNTNLYAAMGRNEGYDSLLCALRGEQAAIETLSRLQDLDAKKWRIAGSIGNESGRARINCLLDWWKEEYVTPRIKELKDLLKGGCASDDPIRAAYCGNYLFEERVLHRRQTNYEEALQGQASDFDAWDLWHRDRYLAQAIPTRSGHDARVFPRRGGYHRRIGLGQLSPRPLRTGALRSPSRARPCPSRS